MPQILAGAQLDRAPGPKYLASLRFAEVAFGNTVPKPSKLAPWRKDLPEDFQLSVVCPRSVWCSEKGALRFTEPMSEALDRFKASVLALEANLVVLPTGGEMTTGQRDRDLLAAWLERLGLPDEVGVVWHPTGLWDLELAYPFAKKLGVTVAIDPLEAELVRGPEVYARLRALGLRARFTETLLLEVADRLREVEMERGWVAIESPRSFKEASRLAALLADE